MAQLLDRNFVTKADLLAAHPQETYMQFYLGYEVSLRKRYKSPLRDDRHPTCAFYKSKSGDLIFKDFSGDFCGDFVNVVMRMFHVNYGTAIRIVANDFNIRKYDDLKKNKGIVNLRPRIIEEKRPTEINVEFKDFTEEDIKWWGRFGITEDILKKYMVYSVNAIFLNKDIFLIKGREQLIYGYYGGISSELELWRIYLPRNKDRRFITNWPSSKIQGWDQLDKSGDVCVITKSMKDVMTFRAMGINAIAPNSEHLFLSDKQLEELKSRFSIIGVLYDNDRTGMHNMWKIRKEHPELVYCVLPQKKGIKDMSDCVAAYGLEKTKKSVEKIISKFKKQTNE